MLVCINQTWRLFWLLYHTIEKIIKKIISNSKTLTLKRTKSNNIPQCSNDVGVFDKNFWVYLPKWKIVWTALPISSELYIIKGIKRLQKFSWCKVFNMHARIFNKLTNSKHFSLTTMKTNKLHLESAKLILNQYTKNCFCILKKQKQLVSRT